jgi:hypothetical protein
VWRFWQEVVSAAEGRIPTEVVAEQLEAAVTFAAPVAETGLAATAGHVITTQRPLNEDLEKTNNKTILTPGGPQYPIGNT